jgi:cyclic beta-1,2-glucan synthetase
MIQLVTESLLGLQRSGDQLRVRPLLPKTWTTFSMHYRFGNSTFAITCNEAAPGVNASLLVDGISVEGDTFTLFDDGRAHAALVTIERTR